MRSRRNEIYLYLCTSVLMMGVDFPRIDIILLCRPMANLHSLVQAAGRGGRKLEDGRRRRVVVYQLWNRQDIIIGNKGLTEDVKIFCEMFNYLRATLKQCFSSNTSITNFKSVVNMWCCGNCTMLVN